MVLFVEIVDLPNSAVSISAELDFAPVPLPVGKDRRIANPALARGNIDALVELWLDVLITVEVFSLE